MSDLGFPVIVYGRGETPFQWGCKHGESHRDGIREIVAIRANLLREKNASLTPAEIERLAAEQWHHTADFDPLLAQELDGICTGAGISRTDVTVLNNYTDFRDIQGSDEGCSVVYILGPHGPIAGQTWDMHRSAKDYVCCIQIPMMEPDRTLVVFSIVGCVGMMGFSSCGSMVGVNNINTDGAVAGVMWPVLVRRLLNSMNHKEMVQQFRLAKVTSGHNYLIASRERADMWEVMPGLAEQVGELSAESPGFLFHTNHCVGERARLRELPAALSSTTHVRYELLAKKVPSQRTLQDVYHLLNDHENYPKSICSNYQASSQDPSVTCGGAVGDMRRGEVIIWRGDELYDANFRRYVFHLSDRDVHLISREPPMQPSEHHA